MEAGPDTGAKKGNEQLPEGGREMHMKPKGQKPVVPSAAFKTTTREKDHQSVRMREVGRLTPGVGHYDAEPDNIWPKRDKLSHILDKDRPHAPSFRVAKLMNATLPARPSSTPLPPTPRRAYKILREIEKIPVSNHKEVASVRRAFVCHAFFVAFTMPTRPTTSLPHEQRLTRPLPPWPQVLKKAVTLDLLGGTGHSRVVDFSATVPVSKQHSAESGVESIPTEGGGEGGDASQAPPKAAGTGALGRSVSPELSYSQRIQGPDLSRSLPRYKPNTGVPTLTGYQFPRGGEATQCYYENVDCLRGHKSTPDLSRSGRDYKDLLLRLG